MNCLPFQDDKTLLTDGEAYLARFSYSRSVMLTEWLDALNVSEEEYQRLATLAEKLG